MYIANDENCNQIFAQEAKKQQSYFCPVCDTPVVLKAGNIKVPHFSHQHIMQCSRYLYKRESMLHLKLKHDLYLELNKYYDTAMEFYLESIEQIPDLLINKYWALEIQLSRISPELILSRTEGYYKLGMKVMWLLDERELKQEGQFLHLNHFQMSTMTNDAVYTIDSKTLEINAWHIGHTAGLNYFLYKKEKIEISEVIKPMWSPCWEDTFKLTKNMMKRIIRREKSQKSVQNKTLTYMYQLGLTQESLPEFLYITSLHEKYIINSPVEWKLYIYYHLSKGIFNRADFYDYIKVRTLPDAPEKNILIQSLLAFYLKVFRISKDIA